MFAELERALDACDFDTSRDRLFSVGDLIDRGPGSDDALAWLESGRIHAATLGNHEAMMVEALYGANEDARQRAHALWRDNGGEWWDRRERGTEELRRWRQALAALPLAITLDTTAHGPVGIVHALAVPRTMERNGATVPRWRCRRRRGRERACSGGCCPSGEAEPRGKSARAGGEPRTIIAGHFASHAPRASGRVVHIDTGAGLDRPGARVTLAGVSAEPITYSLKPCGGRARGGAADGGGVPRGKLAPAPWLVNAAIRAHRTMVADKEAVEYKPSRRDVQDTNGNAKRTPKRNPSGNLSPIARYQPALWIHGHVHNSVDVMLGETRVLANPGAYNARIPTTTRALCASSSERVVRTESIVGQPPRARHAGKGSAVTNACTINVQRGEPALAPVSGTIEQQQRVRSKEHLEDGVGLAAPKLFRIGGEDLPDGFPDW